MTLRNRSFILSLVSILLLTGLASRPAIGQIAIEGQVVDKTTGESLPGASLQLLGSYTGTITNSAGKFSLTVPQLPANLVVRFIGYQSVTVAVEKIDKEPLIVRMLLSTIRLPELTITGEDPAIGIMRQVIEGKQVWKKTLHTYSVSAYNRFRMENDSGIVSIWESGTKAYWDEKRGVREVSLWQEKTQNMRVSDLLPAAMFVMNLYDDDIDVAGHNMMGVTHPKALSFYDFKLEEIKSRDSTEVYIISVAPKLKTSAGFTGFVWVLDEDYALISAQLRPGDAFLFPPPIQYIHASYEQQFSNFGSDVWLPVDFKADLDVKVGMDGILVFPEFKIRQVSSLSGFELNVPVPDSLYDQREVVVKDSSASKVDLLPAERIGVPLTEEEKEAYATIDSTMTIEKAYKPKGILARYVISASDGDGTKVSVSGGVSNRGGKIPFRLKPNLWYNRVEGFHFRLNTTVEPSKGSRVLGMIGYSGAQQRTGWGGGLELGNRNLLKVWYSDEITPQFDSALRSQFFNSFMVVMGDADYFDFYRRKGWTVTASARTPWSRRQRASLSYVNESHASLDQKSFHSIYGAQLDRRSNPPIDSGRLQFVRFDFEGEIEDLPVPIGPQKGWVISAEQGLGGSVLQGGHYTRLEGTLLWRFPTFFSRRLLSNALDIRLVVGSIWGSSLPRQRLGIVDGLTMFSTFGGLKTLDTVPYRGSSWGVLAWEHTFRTVPFEVLGWDWAVRKHWNVIVHGAHGKTWMKDPIPGFVTPKKLHQEVGFSLSGLFAVARLDATWRLDQRDFGLGIALARIF
ncbi:carboxypeptidase-like regulatory domain-containing protein [bacterium]|nr:carboxypeptidase-like regulatory domain-containing protein [bacterium]